MSLLCISILGSLWGAGDEIPLGPGEGAAGITVHLPPAEQANGTAVVICPGGGYAGLMMTYEGHDIARWLNARGVAGIVLRYRVAPNRHPAPWDDVRRALRVVRSRAAEWKIDPARIGVMGFSAGGHLASTVGVHHDAGDPGAQDPVQRVSCRPDFLVLVYPVISMGKKGHSGARANLLGENSDEATREFLSSEKHVTATTPPAFLVHSRADKVVSFEHSVMFHEALKSKGVATEYLELLEGEHGLGCGKGPQWEAWQKACLAWLEKGGLLAK